MNKKVSDKKILKDNRLLVNGTEELGWIAKFTKTKLFFKYPYSVPYRFPNNHFGVDYSG